MKKLFKITALALCLSSLCTQLSSCGKSGNGNGGGSLIESDTEQTEFLTVENPFVSLAVGDEASVLFDYYAKDGKTVTFSSDNETVATVDRSGKITAQNEGACVITASVGTFTATCTVAVGFGDTMPVLSLENVGATTLDIALGDSYGLGAVVKYNGKDYEFTPNYSLSDDTVGKVENGEFTALKEGKTTLTVSGVWRGKNLLPVETEITVTKVNEVKRNTLTVNFVKADGTKLAVSTHKYYSEGVDYSVECPEITGYTAEKTAVTGTMSNSPVIENVVYTPKTYTVTYAVGDLITKEKTQTVTYGEPYELKTVGTSDFYSWNGVWLDENGVITDKSGVWNFAENKTFSTSCSWNKLGFDNDTEKSVFTGITSSGTAVTPTVETIDGNNKVLSISPTNGWWTQVRFNEWLQSVFSDPTTISVTLKAKVKNAVTTYFRWKCWNGTKINREAYPSYIPMTTDWTELTIDRKLYGMMQDAFAHGDTPALDLEIGSGNTAYLDDITVHTVNEYAYKGFENGTFQQNYPYSSTKTSKWSYFLPDGMEFLRIADGGDITLSLSDEHVTEGSSAIKISNNTQQTFNFRINMTYVNNLFACSMVEAIQFDLYSTVNA